MKTIALHFQLRLPRQSFLQTLQLCVSPRLVFLVLHLRLTLPMFGPFFPLPLTPGQKLGIFFFLLQDLHSSSPRHWFGDFVQKACSPFCTADHTTNHFWCSTSILFSYSVFFISNSQYCAIVALYPPIPDEAMLFFATSSQQFTDLPTVVRVHSAFRFDFPRHIRHDFHPSQLPHLFLFISAVLHTFLSLQIIFPERREDSRPAVFTPCSRLTATFRVARSPLQTPKLWLVSRPTVALVTLASRFFSIYFSCFFLLAQKYQKIEKSTTKKKNIKNMKQNL